jgi:hypothetical protein
MFIIYADGLLEVADGGIVEGGAEVDDIGFELFVEGGAVAAADDVVDLAAFLGEGEAVGRLLSEGVERPDAAFRLLVAGCGGGCDDCTVR